MSKPSFQIKKITCQWFQLQNGRKFRHLFMWSSVPDFEDFENLLACCYSTMTDKSLEIDH